MSCLVSDIVSDVITELSMVAGVSTQIYASPKIQQHVQDALIMLVDAQWWPELMDFYPSPTQNAAGTTVVPDGVTGLLTADFVSPKKNHKLNRFQDIQWVRPASTNIPLKILPPNYNPYLLAGTSALYMSPDTTYALRPFMIWPQSSADTLVVRARSYPIIPISSTDTVYLDRLMLTYCACWMYSTDDGTNPGQIAKYEGLFEKRLTQVVNSWQEQSVQLDPRFPANEYAWTERE